MTRLGPLLGLAALLLVAGRSAANPVSAAAVFHPGKPNSVAGYLLVDKMPFATQPTAEDVKRVQTCKDRVLQKDPSLDTPAGAKQAATLINECLGPASPVFTLPWLGSTPIDTYLN